MSGNVFVFLRCAINLLKPVPKSVSSSLHDVNTPNSKSTKYSTAACSSLLKSLALYCCVLSNVALNATDFTMNLSGSRCTPDWGTFSTTVSIRIRILSVVGFFFCGYIVMLFRFNDNLTILSFGSFFCQKSSDESSLSIFRLDKWSQMLPLRSGI